MSFYQHINLERRFHILSEETATEEEIPSTEEVPSAPAEGPREVTEEAPPPVIQIRAPPPFDEEALEPFIGIYMEKRGLTDKKQAAIKLARVLWKMGYDPRKDIQNVTAYINNLSTVLAAIPNTAETMPVKGALLARGAVDTSRMLNRSHFGQQGEMDELKEIMRFGMRMNMATRALDRAYGGGDVNRESETVKDLRSRLDRIEKRSEFEAQLAPVKGQLKTLMDKIGELGKKSATPEESTALKELRGSIQGISERLDKKEERDTLTAEMKGIRDELKAFGEKVVEGAGAGAGAGKQGDVGDVFDKAVILLDKITDVTKKYGGGGGGEFDWKTTAIATGGEVATEFIRAWQEISGGKEGAGAEQEVPTAKRNIIERQLLLYLQRKMKEGAATFSPYDAAEELGATPRQIMAALEALTQKGLWAPPKTSKRGKKSAPTKKTKPTPKVEGVIEEGEIFRPA